MKKFLNNLNRSTYNSRKENRVAMKKVLVAMVIFYCSLAALMLVSQSAVKQPPPPIEEDTKVEPSSISFVCAAHMKDEHFPNAVRVWEDKETDRAVFIRTDYLPKQIVTEGDIVTFNDKKCIVTSTDEQGFAIKFQDGTVAQHGMSGTPICFKGTPIGFVSKALGLQEIYIVYY